MIACSRRRPKLETAESRNRSAATGTAGRSGGAGRSGRLVTPALLIRRSPPRPPGRRREPAPAPPAPPAAELGVFPGLVSHYFATADELVATAFAHAAAAEREQIFGRAMLADRPVERVRRLLESWLHRDRDPVSLLWLDAWQASRRRPALMAEVGRQMNFDLDRLSAIIAEGIAAGQFAVDGPAEPALQILSLIDGQSVQAATREILDYAPVRAMVITTTERLLALPPGTLAPKNF